MMACQSLTKPAQLNTPHNLTQDCPPLSEITLGDGEHMLKDWVKDRRQYVECALSKHALNKAVRPQ